MTKQVARNPSRKAARQKAIEGKIAQFEASKLLCPHCREEVGGEFNSQLSIVPCPHRKCRKPIAVIGTLVKVNKRSQRTEPRIYIARKVRAPRPGELKLLSGW